MRKRRSPSREATSSKLHIMQPSKCARKGTSLPAKALRAILYDNMLAHVTVERYADFVAWGKREGVLAGWNSADGFYEGGVEGWVGWEVEHLCTIDGIVSMRAAVLVRLMR